MFILVVTLLLQHLSPLPKQRAQIRAFHFGCHNGKTKGVSATGQRRWPTKRTFICSILLTATSERRQLAAEQRGGRFSTRWLLQRFDCTTLGGKICDEIRVWFIVLIETNADELTGKARRRESGDRDVDDDEKKTVNFQNPLSKMQSFPSMYRLALSWTLLL